MLLAFCFALPAHAQQWYIPQKTTVLKKGAVDFGTEMQFSVDEADVLNSRSAAVNFSVRYSPLNRLELYIQAPYLYREDEQVLAFGLHSFNDQGLGDIFAQINVELLGRQDWKLMLNTDATFPTGQDPFEHRVGLGGGFYTIAPGLTYLKVVDPAIFFVYLGNQWSLSESFLGTAEVHPGNDMRFRFGASLLLNPRLRGTLYTAGDIVSTTRLGAAKVVASDGEIIRVGGGIDWNINERWRLDINSAFGVTNSTTDAVMSLGLNRTL